MDFKYWVEGPVDGFEHDEAIDRACFKASKGRILLSTCVFIIPLIVGWNLIDFNALSEFQITLLVIIWAVALVLSSWWVSTVKVNCPRCNSPLTPHKRHGFSMDYMTVCLNCKTRCRVRPLGRSMLGS